MARAAGDIHYSVQSHTPLLAPAMWTNVLRGRAIGAGALPIALIIGCPGAIFVRLKTACKKPKMNMNEANAAADTGP